MREWIFGAALLCLFSSFSVYAEVVQCVPSEDVTSPFSDFKLKIEPKGIPGVKNGKYLQATVKGTYAEDRPILNEKTFVKRLRRGNKIVFLDQNFEGKDFEVSIESQRETGTALKGVLKLYAGRAYEQKVENLVCEVTGEPLFPQAPCSKPEDLNTGLMQAAKAGDPDRVSRLLQCGADPNFVDAKGCTALLYVTNLACGTKPFNPDEPIPGGNPTDPNAPGGVLPVPSSALYLNALIKTLGLSGAFLDVADPVTGRTPLMNLVRHGDLSGVEELVSLEADVNMQDIEGNTALMIAASRGNEVMVRGLLSSKADRGIKNKKGETAYSIAEKAGYDDLLELLQPASKVITIQGKANGSCTPTMIHLTKDEPVEIALQASGRMFLLAVPGFDLELMAMANETVKRVIVPARTGTFPFTCGVHGAPADQQTRGEFMVM